MEAEDLHTFGFNKETRKLIQVSMEDAIYASSMVDKIMGDDTSYRKDVLQEYSLYELNDWKEIFTEDKFKTIFLKKREEMLINIFLK